MEVANSVLSNPENKIDSVHGNSDDELELDLEDVLNLVVQKVATLEASLAFYRLSKHPKRRAIIVELVREIDERTDRIAEIKLMILNRSGSEVH